MHLLLLPVKLQNTIENENLPLTITYEIARLRQIGDKTIPKENYLLNYLFNCIENKKSGVIKWAA